MAFSPFNGMAQNAYADLAYAEQGSNIPADRVGNSRDYLRDLRNVSYLGPPRHPERDYEELKRQVKEELIQYFSSDFNKVENMKTKIVEDIKGELESGVDFFLQDAAQKIVGKIVGPIDDKSFAMKATPVPPNQNLNINESNMIQYFTRNPGTGPFTLLFMLAYNGGLLSEPTKSAQLDCEVSEWESDLRKYTTDQMQEALNDAKETIMDESTSELKEEAVKKALFFINNLAAGHIQISGSTPPFENFETFAEGFARKIQSEGKRLTSKADEAGDQYGAWMQTVKQFFRKFRSKEGVESDRDYEALTNVKITASWQLAFVPLLMLLVQFAYVFFVWFEAYQNYPPDSGVCPGYSYVSKDDHHMNTWPMGGDAQTRILSAFIGGYFCFRILQQFITFLSIMKGDNLDPNVRVLPASPKSFTNLWGLLSVIAGESLDEELDIIRKMLENLESSICDTKAIKDVDAASVKCCSNYGKKAESFVKHTIGKELFQSLKDAPTTEMIEKKERVMRRMEDAKQEAMKRYMLSVIDKVANIKGIAHTSDLQRKIQDIENLIDAVLENLAPTDNPCSEKKHAENKGNGVKGVLEELEISGQAAMNTVREIVDNTDKTVKEMLAKGVKKTLKNRRFLLEAVGNAKLPREVSVPVGWRSPKWSWIYPFYLLDCLCALALMLTVFLANLYIVFVDGVSTRDMVLNVVLLDFIYEQLPKFKTEIFNGAMSKNLLYTLKVTYNQPPQTTLWKTGCRLCRKVVLNFIVFVSFLSFFVSAGMIMYGPLCKPGPATAGTVPSVKRPA